MICFLSFRPVDFLYFLSRGPMRCCFSGNNFKKALFSGEVNSTENSFLRVLKSTIAITMHTKSMIIVRSIAFSMLLFQLSYLSGNYMTSNRFGKNLISPSPWKTKLIALFFVSIWQYRKKWFSTSHKCFVVAVRIIRVRY